MRGVWPRRVTRPVPRWLQHYTRARLHAIPCIILAEVGALMLRHVEQRGSKVPEVTLVFWIIKIAATTLGETFGDTVTMTLNWGYLVGTAIFFSLLVALVVWQIAVDRFHPFLYWATIVASTTAGTTIAHYADRSLGIGYAGGLSLLFVCLITVLGMWYWSLGSISVATVSTPKVEGFLLGGYYLFPNARHGAWRLDGRRYGFRIRRRRARIRRRVGGAGRRLLLDERFAGPLVLGRIYSLHRLEQRLAIPTSPSATADCR